MVAKWIKLNYGLCTDKLSESIFNRNSTAKNCWIIILVFGLIYRHSFIFNKYDLIKYDIACW